MNHNVIVERIQDLEKSGSPLQRLPRDFYTQDGLSLAKALLGKVLIHHTDNGIIKAVITETEAYMGINDKGSHTYGGRRTERTEPMYHIGGTTYVYFTYGMYHCMNITATVENIAQAALLRGVIPFDKSSKAIMLKNRQLKNKNCTEKNLSNGPGKLCIAMDITKKDNNIDMATSEVFYVTEGIDLTDIKIQESKRIGIDYAEEAADFLWRFFI